MNQLNELEVAVLDWVSEHSGNSDLAAQLESAVFTDREWTKAGFHIGFKVDICCLPIDLAFPITGPDIDSPEIAHGGGSLILGQNGFVNGIEMFAYGDEFPEDVDIFSLQKCPIVENQLSPIAGV
jgi:hypothetical protein